MKEEIVPGWSLLKKKGKSLPGKRDAQAQVVAGEISGKSRKGKGKRRK
jgi:hypothetical protein